MVLRPLKQALNPDLVPKKVHRKFNLRKQVKMILKKNF